MSTWDLPKAIAGPILDGCLNRTTLDYAMQQLQEALARLASIDVAALSRAGRDFDFTDVHPLLVEGVAKVQRLAEASEFWTLYPDEQKQTALGRIDEFIKSVESIRDFSPQRLTNPQQERDNLASQVRRVYGELYSTLFLSLRVHDMEGQLQVGAQKLEAEAKRLVSELQGRRAEADKVLDSMKAAAGQTGLARFATVFAEEAARRAKAADRWLAVALFSGLALGAFLWWSLDQLNQAFREAVDSTRALQLLVAKLVVLSFVSFGFYQVIKNYNANRHLEALNKHRANTLQAFQVFVEASSDPQVRDAVLIHAARAIFEAGQTGYVSSAAPPAAPGVDTIRVLDRFRGE